MSIGSARSQREPTCRAFERRPGFWLDPRLLAVEVLPQAMPIYGMLSRRRQAFTRAASSASLRRQSSAAIGRSICMFMTARRKEFSASDAQPLIWPM
eukprot:1482375-Pyramimonas_sp.AAC.1